MDYIPMQEYVKCFLGGLDQASGLESGASLRHKFAGAVKIGGYVEPDFGI